jgi:hypothetical protein
MMQWSFPSGRSYSLGAAGALRNPMPYRLVTLGINHSHGGLRLQYRLTLGIQLNKKPMVMYQGNLAGI